MSSTPELPDFQQYQFTFTRHIRNPQQHPRPAGVPARRMQVYNQLLYNNLDSFLLSCFPVARKILGLRKWRRLVRSFFSEHRCHSPFFRHIPEALVQYLQQHANELTDYPAFLAHLAHYEWVELALDTSNQMPDVTAFDPDGDLLAARPYFNPVAMALTYPYPVHRIRPEFQPQAQEQTYLLVFRDLADKVRFMVLNPVSARLVDLLQQSTLSGEQALQQIAVELQHPDPEVVVQGGQQILQELRQQQAILGTYRHYSPIHYQETS